MPESLRLLIVDPDVNFRTDLRKQMSRAGVAVIGEAGYGADAVSLAQGTRPDAVMVAWQEPTARARSWAQLPAQAIKYVRRIEELIGCPVTLLSTSPEREDTILMKNPFET